MLQQMVEEFKQQEEVIKSLETQAEKYNSEGKVEATKRLNFQIDSLKVTV